MRRGATVTCSVEDGLATLRIEREHGNAINLDLAEDLSAEIRRLSDDPGVRGALLTAGGKLFCPGLDLRDLVDLDRPAMEHFMRRFGGCLLDAYTFPKPLVAALGGHALAGGCVLATTTDWRVLKDGAMVGLNETMVGVPLPYGVSLILRETVVPSRLVEVALEGRNYRGEEAVAVGLVHEVHTEEGLEEHARARLAELASRHATAYGLTKMHLRSATAERIRANDEAHLPGFLDCWFSEDTRRRIAGIVADLRK